MHHPTIILASASPRRRELLSLVFGSFSVIPSEFDESTVPSELAPAEHVVHSALMKARDIAARHTGALVIGADTVVVVDGNILGKPANSADAARMLKKFSGKTHQVYTGVAVVEGSMERSGAECTDVTFCELSQETISRYVATGEPLDKAGAYAIQGKGAVLIKCVRGCYPNVVGLPIYLLTVLLADFGIEVLCDR